MHHCLWQASYNVTKVIHAGPGWSSTQQHPEIGKALRQRLMRSSGSCTMHGGSVSRARIWMRRMGRNNVATMSVPLTGDPSDATWHVECVRICNASPQGRASEPQPSLERELYLDSLKLKSWHVLVWPRIRESL